MVRFFGLCPVVARSQQLLAAATPSATLRTFPCFHYKLLCGGWRIAKPCPRSQRAAFDNRNPTTHCVRLWLWLNGRHIDMERERISHRSKVRLTLCCTLKPPWIVAWDVEFYLPWADKQKNSFQKQLWEGAPLSNAACLAGVDTETWRSPVKST